MPSFFAAGLQVPFPNFTAGPPPAGAPRPTTNRARPRPLACSLGLTLIAGGQTWGSSPLPDKTDALLSTMQQEMQRAQTSLSKLDPAPYFLSYSVYDQSASVAIGAQGGL